MELDGLRWSMMRDRELGLTKLYHLVHDERITDADVQRLREIHVGIDDAVAEAYGFTDLRLGHGFHNTRQGIRFTVAPAAQTDVLDQLLELNHSRHAEELRTGAHAAGRRKAVKSRMSGSTQELPSVSAGSSADNADGFQDGLFPVPDALF